MLAIILMSVLLAVPRYYVVDVKRIGIEPLLKQGAKLITQVDSITFLVEGNLEEMERYDYEIALYQPVEKMAKSRLKSGKYFIPDLPEINYYLSQVNADSIISVIQRLEDFRTRFAYTDSCRAAEFYLAGKAQNYCDLGYLWPFSYNNVWMNNVVGLKNGALEDFILITSHLDSYSPDPWNNAPGADDNGSGCGVVIECARILSNIENPLITLQFVPFSAEEVGLVGSYRYAENIVNNNLPLHGVLNFDMVGYNPNDGYDFDVNLDTLSLFGQVVLKVINYYVNGNNRYSYSPFSGSDHYPFAIRGYPWVFLIEANYQANPNYHRITDLVTTLDADQLVSAAKIAVGTALYYALLPLPPESLVVINYGDGDRVVLEWPRVSYPGGVSYQIYRGSSPTSLNFVAEVYDTFATLNGNPYGENFYFTVRTKYNNRVGFGTPIEKVFVDSIPQPPVISKIQPLRNSISLYWHKSSERDVEGYYVYRGIDGEDFVRINAAPESDTFYIDLSANESIWYRYYVTAVDSSGYESERSEIVSARPVTLERELLVLDDFRDGTGNPINPNSAMQLAFIDTVLSSIGLEDYDVLDLAQVSMASLSDIGIYKLVWVFSDDAGELLGSKYRDALLQYHQMGGKLIIEGFKNAQNLGIIVSYPAHVNSDVFPFDSIFINTAIDFAGAYSDLNLSMLPNPTKLSPSWSGRMQNIEAFNLAFGTPLFYFDSYSNNTNFEGRVCGVLVGDSLVYLGFPLYQMRTEDVISFFQYLRNIGFVGVIEEVTAAKPDVLLKGSYLIIKNFDSGRIFLYDISGRLVKGGAFDNGRFHIGQLPSGVYFYVITSNKNEVKGKFILVR